MAFDFDPFGIFGGDKGIVGAITGSSNIYGTKPTVPKAPTPGDIVGTANRANLENYPTLDELSRLINTSNQQQLLTAFEAAAPGTGAARAKQLENIQAGLEGQIPKDVADLLQNQNAAWRAAGGTGGAQVGDWRNLRNLGLTSLQRQDTAGNQLNTVLENVRKYTIPQLFNQQAQMIQPRYDPYFGWSTDWLTNKVAAAPDPGAAGAAAAQQALLESILSIYSGSPKSAATNPQNYGQRYDTVTPNYGGSGAIGGGVGGYDQPYAPQGYAPGYGVGTYGPG